ncbi:MAG: hypothetical protein JST84_30435 [Acidobacteria bacterium]|nr:hypothetical protein [Acidobacteriota bacterium]
MNFKLYKRLTALSCAALLLSLWIFGTYLRTHGQQPTATQPRDPKAWGGNHVGKPIPDFVHGDECLFCHRNTIGAHWQENAHGVTLRQLEDAGKLRDLLKQPELASVAKDIEYFLGSRNHIRFLKKEGFGKFAILNTRVVLDDSGKVINWIEKDQPTWDKEKFGNNCAGCHATGVDTKTKTFAAFGLDCYVCHGDVNLEHSNDTKLMILSKKRHDESELITSICAQCHLREGKSNSTGLPYPNTYIAGDNLFQDFNVDFAKADDEKLNRIDRHIYRNVREVAVQGKTSPTCLSCHQVHFDSRAQSYAKHIIAPRGPICFDCHASESDMKSLKPYEKTSKVCEY